MKEPERYWLAEQDPVAFAECAMDRFTAGQDRMRTSRRHFRLRRSWMEYNSRDQQSNADETDINAAGERGELTLLRPALYRRQIQDQLSQAMQTPPDFQPMALNTDPESQAASQLSLGLLDHYKRVMHLEDLGIERLEMALVLTESALHLPWDESAGKEVVPDEQSPGGMMYEGDFVPSVRSPYEFCYDPTSPDRRKPRWWTVREPYNKWDAIEKWAKKGYNSYDDELRDAILKSPKWTHYAKEWNYEQNEYEYDDSIAIHYVYGEQSPAKPDGCRAIVLDAKHCLIPPGPLGEVRAPVFRLAPSEVIFKPEGYSANIDGLPICKALAAQISSILSNETNYALTRILAARKANIKHHLLDTGLSVIDWDHYDPATGSAIPEPHAMDLNGTQATSFTFFEVLQALLDTVMGGSPVTRGDPKATQGDSGSKAAMLYAAGQAVGANYLRAKFRSDEEIATFIVQSMARHATAPRMISIVGKNNSYEAREFIGADLKKVPRVLVRQADPARDTFSGRLTMVQTIGGMDPPNQERMAQLVYTGKLEPIIEPEQRRKMLIDRENEALLDSKKPPPIVRKEDPHMQHYKEHAEAFLSNLDARNDPQLTSKYEAHQQWHVDSLTIGSPKYAGDDVLRMTGQGPLPPPGNPAPPGGIPQPSDEDGGNRGPASQPQSQDQQAVNNGKQPGLPAMPRNAATGQKMGGGPNIGSVGG